MFDGGGGGGGGFPTTTYSFFRSHRCISVRSLLQAIIVVLGLGDGAGGGEGGGALIMLFDTYVPPLSCLRRHHFCSKVSPHRIRITWQAYIACLITSRDR